MAYATVNKRAAGRGPMRVVRCKVSQRRVIIRIHPTDVALHNRIVRSLLYITPTHVPQNIHINVQLYA